MLPPLPRAAIKVQYGVETPMQVRKPKRPWRQVRTTLVEGNSMAGDLAELRQTLAPSPTSEMSRTRRGTGGTSMSSDAEDFEDFSVPARRSSPGRESTRPGTSPAACVRTATQNYHNTPTALKHHGH